MLTTPLLIEFTAHAQKEKAKFKLKIVMSSEEVSAIKETLSLLLEHDTVKEFASIWDEIGIEDRIRQERRDKMLQYHCNLQAEMLEEERALKKRMEDSIETCTVELVQLETQLKLCSTIVSLYRLLLSLVNEGVGF